VQGLSLADLGVDASRVGLANAATGVADFARRPPRSAGEIVTDEGDGGSGAAAFLAGRKFI
jgi:electron transfer flavoprotein beta subunit